MGDPRRASPRVTVQVVVCLDGAPVGIFPLSAGAISGVIGSVPGASPSILDSSGAVIPHSGPAVLASLEHDRNGLEALRTAWVAHRMSKKPRSAREYGGVVRAALEEMGATAAPDLTFSRLSEYLAGKVTRKEWRGNTHNRNLSALRSFTKYLLAAGVLERDPLAMMERADRDDAPGARAATVTEARGILTHARACEIADRRSKGSRALYWAALFLSGSRFCEPGRWRWRCLLLEESSPAIAWEPGYHKNKREIVLPLHPELHRLLLEHRAHMRALVASGEGPHIVRSRRSLEQSERAFNPDDPAAFVFPVVPADDTFEDDRRRAGIVKDDARGRQFSPHSARKFVSTELRRAGVDAALVDKLLRHLGGVSARYDDRTHLEMASAIARLPGVWPWALGNGVDSNSAGIFLTKGGSGAEDTSARPAYEHTRTQSHQSPPPVTGAHADLAVCKGAGAAGSADFPREALTGGGPLEGPPVESANFNPRIAVLGLENWTDSTEAERLADLLESFARFLRGPRRGNGDRTG